jgi:hypothetical protein
MNKNTFVVSDPSDIETLKSALSRSFPQLKEMSETIHFEVQDTFDWRLYQTGWHLYRKDSRFDIVATGTGQVVTGIDVAGRKERRFIWDFPSSDFTAALEPVLEMRALLPMARIEEKIERLSVRNADEKTVARIELASLGIAGDDCRVIHCRLLPMRGYARDSRNIRAILEALDFTPATESAVLSLLKATGAEPGTYSSKVNVSLEPGMAASLAVRRILKNLVTVMHQNLEGVRKDIDTEFLHDLRVAIRRSRSLLGQTKGVFDAETTAMLQTHLKTMGGVSGDVRDLDVYLLEKESYVQKVPEPLRPGVLQLFRTLQRKRHSAKDRMLKVMGEAGFTDALAALDNFLGSEPPEDAGAESTTPIGE